MRLFDPLGYYTLLEVNPQTLETQLKKNYRDKAKFWHPDHNKSDEAMEIFQKLSVAYEILNNKKERAVYDILSTAYTAADFPDMSSLKIYKSADGEETPFLRVFKLYKVKGFKPTEEKLIGTFQDAAKFIQSITAADWLKGWWSPKLFKQTISGLRQNYQNINQNTADNFRLLAHNAAAYLREDKKEKAALCLMQALEYATPAQREILENVAQEQRFEQAVFKPWDFKYLQKIQLKIPLTLASIGLVLGLFFGISWYQGGLEQMSKVVSSYYQKVRFNTGTETVDDLVVSKIFNIPVDAQDTNMLYHLTSAQQVMYGPSEKFDVLAEAKRNQTVRVTGYTPDEVWYRIMLDNGEMVFIKKEYLKKGVADEIPADSKIFRNPDGQKR